MQGNPAEFLAQLYFMQAFKQISFAVQQIQPWSDELQIQLAKSYQETNKHPQNIFLTLKYQCQNISCEIMQTMYNNILRYYWYIGSLFYLSKFFIEAQF